MKVTKHNLCRYGIFKSQIEPFKRYWPEGCEITVENLKFARRNGLELTIVRGLKSHIPATVAASYELLICDMQKARSRFLDIAEEEHQACMDEVYSRAHDAAMEGLVSVCNHLERVEDKPS
jgi:hypothetical protein